LIKKSVLFKKKSHAWTECPSKLGAMATPTCVSGFCHGELQERHN
jgi:hypothetical protein